MKSKWNEIQTNAFLWFATTPTMLSCIISDFRVCFPHTARCLMPKVLWNGHTVPYTVPFNGPLPMSFYRAVWNLLLLCCVDCRSRCSACHSSCWTMGWTPCTSSISVPLCCVTVLNAALTWVSSPPLDPVAGGQDFAEIPKPLWGGGRPSHSVSVDGGGSTPHHAFRTTLLGGGDSK